MRRAALLIATALVGLSSTPAATAASGVALPNSMASTGDSITRAYDSTSSGCFLSDCPHYSWSTGTAGTTSVNSHYLRVLAANSRIRGNAYDDAKTGAKMGALDGQLTTAASQHVEYATVLMGANDICTSSISTMTPTATFQKQFHTALTDFFAADPN